MRTPFAVLVVAFFLGSGTAKAAVIDFGGTPWDEHPRADWSIDGVVGNDEFNSVYVDLIDFDALDLKFDVRYETGPLLGGHPKPAINGQLKTGHFE